MISISQIGALGSLVLTPELQKPRSKVERPVVTRVTIMRGSPSGDDDDGRNWVEIGTAGRPPLMYEGQSLTWDQEGKEPKKNEFGRIDIQELACMWSFIWKELIGPERPLGGCIE